MRSRMVLTATLALAIGATGAQAQGFPGGGGGFPGGGGARGGRGGMPRGGQARFGAERPVVPDLGNPLHLILENKDTLKLTTVQAQQVDSMARALDQRNDTLIATVRRAFGRDSGALGAGPAAQPTGGSIDPSDRRAGEAIALRDRLNVLKPTFDRIKKNDDAAWKDATAVLDKNQRKQADRLRKQEEQKRQPRFNPRNRGRNPGAGGEGGEGGDFPGGDMGGGPGSF